MNNIKEEFLKLWQFSNELLARTANGQKRFIKSFKGTVKNFKEHYDKRNN